MLLTKTISNWFKKIWENLMQKANKTRNANSLLSLFVIFT